jgi:hypothetical protein
VPIVGATNAIYASDSFSYPAEDSVACVVTSSLLCHATGFKWVFVQVARVGVGAITTGGVITLLPNPTSGDFVLKGSLGTNMDEEATIQITDIVGQEVLNKKVLARSGQLNELIHLVGVANGMYVLTLHSESGNKVFHLVVEQ